MKKAIRTYNYVLLDWDGNLIKTLELWVHACRVPLEKRGINLTDHEIGASLGQHRAYMDRWGVTDPDEVMIETLAIGRAMLPKVELYPDVIESLRELKYRNKKLALVTTGTRDEVRVNISRFGMDDLFDVMVTHEDVSNHKPHAEPLEKALRELGGSKVEAVMVGDSDKDLGAALNFGIDSVLFHSEDHGKFHKLDELEKHKPTHVITEFRQLIDVIK